MHRINITVILSFLIFFNTRAEGIYYLASPGADCRITITEEDGMIMLSQKYKQTTLIDPSPLGLMVDGEDLSKNNRIIKVDSNNWDNTWKTVNGKFREVRNHYNEYRFFLERQNLFPYQIIFRCYDEGFAYRYHFPLHGGNDQIKLEAELTKINFAQDYNYWSYNGERHNLGPIQRSEQNLPSALTPMVLRFKNGIHLAIHEAAIFRYAPFNLSAASEGFSVGFNVSETNDRLPVTTSWRTFMIAENAGDLIEYNLLVNLNESCKIEDTSWIRPGISMWDWRIWGYEAEHDDFLYAQNTSSHKRIIDFASSNNIDYLLIDADWYGSEFSSSSDPSAARQEVDIEQIMAYADKKDIGIFLYLNDVAANKYGLEAILQRFAAWGAVGVKYGFLRGSWEEKVRNTRKIVELCANYRLMVDFHDYPVPPSGDRRTWPNLMTKEYCHAQADARRSSYPETIVTAPFVNMLAGPIDTNDGWFDLDSAHSRVRVFREIPGTVSAEVAKLIVIYSGLRILPDSPEEYLKKSDLFDCIRKMPGQFDSYRVLSGEIGEYISVARKSGDQWFVGNITNRQARTITISLDFLEKDKSYLATFYQDQEETHFMHNKEAYQIKKDLVNSNTSLSISMAPGGGQAIFFEPNNPARDAKAIPKVEFDGTLYVYTEDNSTNIAWSDRQEIKLGNGAKSNIDGSLNTKSIVAELGKGEYAAYLCDTLEAHGFDDWYLPSDAELKVLYENRYAIGKFSNDYYWSSTEDGPYSAGLLHFEDGYQSSWDKANWNRVRCVRRD